MIVRAFVDEGEEKGDEDEENDEADVDEGVIRLASAGLGDDIGECNVESSHTERR